MFTACLPVVIIRVVYFYGNPKLVPPPLPSRWHINMLAYKSVLGVIVRRLVGQYAQPAGAAGVGSSAGAGSGRVNIVGLFLLSLLAERFAFHLSHGAAGG